MRMKNFRNGILLVLLCCATWVLFGNTKAPTGNISARGDAIIRSGQERVVRNRAPHANVDLTDTTGTLSTVEEFGLDASTSELQAMELSRGITKIDGIRKASVVVSGNIAIVGIETEGEFDDGKLIKIKQLAEKEVKRIDPTINHVAVTSAPDLIKRIINMDGYTTEAEPDYSHNAEETLRELTPAVW